MFHVCYIRFNSGNDARLRCGKNDGVNTKASQGAREWMYSLTALARLLWHEKRYGVPTF